MRYILTLLKDLPDYPAGTKFIYIADKRHYDYKSDDFTSMECVDLLDNYLQNDRKYIYRRFVIPEKIINNPDWIKKEIAYFELLDIKCPICGETRGKLEMAVGGVDKLYIEYACGHKLRRLI